jgi:hypothetical protein
MDPVMDLVGAAVVVDVREDLVGEMEATVVGSQWENGDGVNDCPTDRPTDLEDEVDGKCNLPIVMWRYGSGGKKGDFSRLARATGGSLFGKIFIVLLIV